MRDYAGLSDAEKQRFREAVVLVNEAYDLQRARGHLTIPKWPKSLRIKDVEGATGVWELTWSFSGPDGRATFEYVHVDGETAIRWRRIGSHRIFSSP